MALSSTEELRGKLKDLAVRETRLTVVTGVLRIVIAVVVFVVLFFAVDWLLRLSVLFRLICMGAGIGGLVWLIRTYLVLPLRIERNEETEALKLENHFAYLNDRLISVIQLTGSAADKENNSMSRSLIQRLEADILTISTDIRFSEVIDWKFIRRIGLIAAGIFLAAVLSTFSFPEYVMITVKRMFLSSQNYPVLTHIRVKGYDDRIVEGDDWNIRISLSGEIPSTVYLLRRKSGKDEPWEEFEFKPGLGFDYSLTLKKILDSFEFKVVAGDGTVGPVQVSVLEQLTVSDPLLDITPPAYTGIAPSTGEGIRTASIVDGSFLRITIPANKRIVSGKLLTGDGNACTLSPHKEKPAASAEFIAACRYETGQAVQFDGVGQTARLSYRDTFNPGRDNQDFSVEFWLYLMQDATGKWRSLIHKGSNNKERTFKMSLHPKDNRIHYRISTSENGNEGGDSRSGIPLKKWTHVVYVKKDNKLLLYLNGEQDSVVTLSAGVIANKGKMYVANSPWEAGVKCKIDQLLIYDRALSRNDIQLHYNNGNGTVDFSRKQLSAGYLFDGNETDISGNANTLELVNKPPMKSGIVQSRAERNGKPILRGKNGVVSFTVRLKDIDGLYNSEPLVRYSFRVRKDQDPRVRINYPDSKKTTVPIGEWKIEYTAADDFGVEKTWLAWGIHERSTDPVADLSDFDSEEADPEERTVSYIRRGRKALAVPKESLRYTSSALLRLLDLNVSPGHTVDVWIEAADARVGEIAETKQRFERIPGFSKSKPVQFDVIDQSGKWHELYEKLKEIEHDVIKIKDSQENIKKDTRQIKENLKEKNK